MDTLNHRWLGIFTVTDSMREIGSSDCFAQLLKDMTFNQLRMIKIVHELNREYPEGVTLKVLAESLSITPAAASEMVDALTHKGMLLREHNMQDRRAVAISLGKICQDRFAQCESCYDEIIEGFFASIDEEERDNFLATLHKLEHWVEAGR